MSREEGVLREYVLAFSRSGSIEQVKEILDENPSLLFSLDEITGNSALHMAAEGNHVDVIQYLLSLKIDINQLNNFGETALHRASIRGSEEAVQELLSSGIDHNLKNRNQNTAFDIAKNNEIRSIFHKNIGVSNQIIINGDDDSDDEGGEVENVEIGNSDDGNSDDDDDGDDEGDFNAEGEDFN